MPEISVHDNKVVSYLVDGQHRRIVLHTQSEGRELIDIIFEGVLAYHFENDNFKNILFDVVEVSVGQVVADDRSLFEAGSKYC
jgi:hypothetical protein